ncbi:uncharacterized protein LOC111243905 isoform X2 [Varroa destructor]|uniref:Chitin-binding type-2 domain-containing protein n=1 Tax=Varroa destructor TaxID=109461 RepID=A0A7M7J2P7_VARDE|nr:uncharacterized protein LOC111243905 isoform X2 [Varroa destructor]
MCASVRLTRSLSAGCLAIFIAHLISTSIVQTVPGVVANRHLSKRISSAESQEHPYNGIRQNEAVYYPEDMPGGRRLADGRLQARPGYKLIRVKAPHNRRRSTTTTTTTPPPEDYYYYEVPEDEVPEITTTTRRPVQRQQQQQQQQQQIDQRNRQRQREPSPYQRQSHGQHIAQQQVASQAYNRYSTNNNQYPQQAQSYHQIYNTYYQSQRVRQEPQRLRQPQRVRRPPQDYYEYNDLPSAEEESNHYAYNYATFKPRHVRPQHRERDHDRDYRDRDHQRDRDYPFDRDRSRERYDGDDDDEERQQRPRKKYVTTSTTTTTTTTTTTSTEPPKPTTTLSPGYKERSDGRVIDYLADPNFPRELTGADLTDYPFYISVPDDIRFDCDKHGDGFFASIEHHCQLFHYCFGGYRYSFLCPNYTVYDQTTFTCRFVNTVQCDKSKAYYKRNDALFKDTTTTTTTTTTIHTPTVAEDTIAKEAVKALKRPKPAKSTNSKSKTTTTTEAPIEYEDEYYDEEYEDEQTATATTTPAPSAKAKPKTPSTTPSTTTTTTTTTTSKPPPLLAGRKARLSSRAKLLGNRS